MQTLKYRRHSNYASFLILRQNATFQTGNFQWCITLRKLISYCCVTRIIWLQKWMVIVACHHWCIKLRHICNMAMTSFVVRDDNGNRNSSPMFLFSVWGHLRIPRVSKNMDASCRRKSKNGKRTRKRTWPIRFEHGNPIEIRNGIMSTRDCHTSCKCLLHWIWTPHVGEKATTVGNEYDWFAVAVFEDEMLCTVGHLLWEIYRIAFTGFSNYAWYF